MLLTLSYLAWVADHLGSPTFLDRYAQMPSKTSGVRRLRRLSVRALFLRPAILFALLLFPLQPQAAEFIDHFANLRTLYRLSMQHQPASGAFILEKGEDALLARAWMVGTAVDSLDILTFIWKLDNIGIIATDALLRAADRGVRVRVVVDDMVLQQKDLETLLALAAHPRIDIRIYNPERIVGVSIAELVINVLTDFRQYNQRLHNKSFLADGIIGITGGRNVANEYFDYDQKYNFRDRDIMVVGPVVDSMQKNFETFWSSNQARPIEELLPARRAGLSDAQIRTIYGQLHACAERLIEQLPLVKRVLLDREERMAGMLRQMVWTPQIWFVSDLPGKNLGKPGLGGGGRMAEALAGAIAEARKEITIQSPYMVLEGEGLGLYEKLHDGVEVQISTNSLASTDNIAAFSGYAKERQDLLNAGFLIREFRPRPEIERELIDRYLGRGKEVPIFVLHAKSLVVDGELLYVGTYNIDPRSASLNTEEGIFVRNRELASQVEEAIEKGMLPENSWNPRLHDPNRKAGWWRRLKLGIYRLLPIDPLL